MYFGIVHDNTSAMAPIALDNTPAPVEDIADLKKRLQSLTVDDLHLPPDNTLKRYQKAGIDLSKGYPYFPPKPDFVQQVAGIRTELREYVDPATRADRDKKALFSAAKEVKHLSTHIGVSQLQADHTTAVLISHLDRDHRAPAQGLDRSTAR